MSLQVERKSIGDRKKGDRRKPQDLTLVAKAMQMSPRKSVDQNRSTLSNPRYSPTTPPQQLRPKVNAGRMIQSQHVAERAKLGTRLLNRSGQPEEPHEGEFDSREGRSRKGRRGHGGLGQSSKEHSPLSGANMPKIVTGKDQNPLEIDRDGNRTHLKLAAVDALNPAAALAKR